MSCDPSLQVHCWVYVSILITDIHFFYVPRLFLSIVCLTRHITLSLMMTTSPDIVKYCLSDIKYLRSHNKTNDDLPERLIYDSFFVEQVHFLLNVTYFFSQEKVSITSPNLFGLKLHPIIIFIIDICWIIFLISVIKC